MGVDRCGSGLPGNRGVGMSWRSVPTRPLLCFPTWQYTTLFTIHLSHDASQFTNF